MDGIRWFKTIINIDEDVGPGPVGSWNLCVLCRQAPPEEDEFCRGDWSGTLNASNSTPARK
jgi:hypothetical protein